LAPRPAALIAALLLAGCLREPRPEARAEGCLSCHPAHTEGACQGCHRGDPSARRQELAHARLLTGRAAEFRARGGAAVHEGRELVERAACRRCHTIAGEGNHLAGDLDRVVTQREQPELIASIRTPVENMPDFGLRERQAQAIVAFLLTGADGARPQDAYRVHFARGERKADLFQEKCGGCHRALGPAGPLGSGSAGPNLSGLLTPFYPPTAPGEAPWSRRSLAERVRNPRSAQARATMPPIEVSDDELGRLIAQIAGPEEAAP
jgi:mono/diheme cytochrome c family protein